MCCYKDGSSAKPSVTEHEPKEFECVNLDGSSKDEV
jgi:hypothetical protein